MRYHVFSEEEACAIRPEIGDVIRLWDYEFRWTSKHQLPNILGLMRYEVDSLADAVLDELRLQPRQDAYEALRLAAESKDAAKFPNCTQLWKQMTEIPDFVDFSQIERGQDVFYKYVGAALTGLLNDSLLGGFGARRISEVLVRTGSFGAESARRRLLKTTQWILEVMESPDALRLDGAGFKSTIRVRLLHAQVRKRMLSVCEGNPDYYDIAANGIPINNLHSLVTLTSFSTTLIDHTFPKMYVYLSKQQRNDYIAIWRYVAYLIGADEKYFCDADTARALLESTLLAELWPDLSETSHTRTLLHNSISSLANQPPSNMSYDYICAQVRWLHGDNYCDAIGLPPVSWQAKLVTASKVNFFLLMSLLGHAIPGFDDQRIKRIRPVLYNMVVNSKEVGLGGPVSFELEWMPSLTSLVRRHTGPNDLHPGKGGIGMEKHYITALFVVIGSVTGATFLTGYGSFLLFRHMIS